MGDEKELTQAIIASIEKMQEAAEWRGRISALMETTVAGMGEMKAKQSETEKLLFARLDEFKRDIDKKIGAMSELTTNLRVKVAGWSALFGSLATIFLYFIMKFVFKA